MDNRAISTGNEFVQILSINSVEPRNQNVIKFRQPESTIITNKTSSGRARVIMTCSEQTWTGRYATVPWHRRPFQRTQATPSKNKKKKNSQSYLIS